LIVRIVLIVDCFDCVVISVLINVSFVFPLGRQYRVVILGLGVYTCGSVLSTCLLCRRKCYPRNWFRQLPLVRYDIIQDRLVINHVMCLCR
jgi:hypothetical protein